MLRVEALGERLRLRLWLIPGAFALAAVVAARVVLEVDARLSGDVEAFFVFGGTAEGARSVLSTVAQSMLTFTGLVFTVTMLVLQLASNQLSPRVMRTYLRDRGNQVVLGLFVATFLFTLFVLREVRSPAEGEAFVPAVSTWVAFVLLIASLVAFVLYIDHMAHAIRATTVIYNIADETRAAIERLYPHELEAARDDASGARGPRHTADRRRAPHQARGAELPALRRTVHAARAGVLVSFDQDRLVALAASVDGLVELVPTPGDFVPFGAPLVRIRDTGAPGEASSDRDGGQNDGSGGAHARIPDEVLDDRLRESVSFENERTLQQDAPFGIRQLVDVAARALSPGTNDPTTAVQAIDLIHDALRRLVGRSFPAGRYEDEHGIVRLVTHPVEWDDYVSLAFDELRIYGRGHLQVARRLAYALRDLASAAPPDRRAALVGELGRLTEDVGRNFADRADRDRAVAGSARGQGPDRAELR